MNSLRTVFGAGRQSTATRKRFDRDRPSRHLPVSPLTASCPSFSFRRLALSLHSPHYPSLSPPLNPIPCHPKHTLLSLISPRISHSRIPPSSLSLTSIIPSGRHNPQKVVCPSRFLVHYQSFIVAIWASRSTISVHLSFFTPRHTSYSIHMTLSVQSYSPPPTTLPIHAFTTLWFPFPHTALHPSRR